MIMGMIMGMGMGKGAQNDVAVLQLPASRTPTLSLPLSGRGDASGDVEFSSLSPKRGEDR